MENKRALLEKFNIVKNVAYFFYKRCDHGQVHLVQRSDGHCFHESIKFMACSLRQQVGKCLVLYSL